MSYHRKLTEETINIKNSIYISTGKMDVTICSFTGYKALNGANLRAYFIGKELEKRGHNLHFIVPSNEDVKSCHERFKCSAIGVNLNIQRFSSSRLKLYPLFAVKASKLIPNRKGIVFGTSLPSALAVRLAKTKSKKAIDYVDLWSEYWRYANPSLKGQLIYQAVKAAESFSLQKQHKVFTITKELARYLMRRGCKRDRISVVRDGVDTEMFKPFKPKKEFYEKYKLDKNAEYVIYQGGIAAHDGVQFLVSSANLILQKRPDVKFLIVGAGAYYNRIRALVATLKLEKNFHFTGWINYEDMPAMMNAAKVNVVPLPDAPATRTVVTYKLFEGMASGVPTVIGDLPGVKEAVKHEETAYLVKSENREALANGILTMLEDKKLYTKIRKNGLDLAKNHDWRDIAKDIVDVLEKV